MEEDCPHGKRKGREAVYEQYGTYLGGTDGTFKAELLYFAADDQGRAIGVHRNTGTRNGRTLDTMFELTAERPSRRVHSPDP